MMQWAERKDGLVFAGVTLLLLLLTTAGRTPGLPTSTALLALGVVLFGMPHGALDPLVARRVLGVNRLPGLLLFLVGYALVAAAYGLVWWWSAPLGLASFLCISAFHFGTDWQQRGHLLTRCAYGLAIVTLPVLRHAAEVRQIYAVLSPGVGEGLIHFSQALATPAALVALLAAVLQWRTRRRDLLEMLGILIGALALPPLLYFGCYFCLLHSPRHLFETAREEGLVSIAAIVRAAAPATGAPLLLAAVFFVRSSPHTLNEGLLQIIFIGLAVLTVPHMILQAIAHARTQHGALNVSPEPTT